MAQPEKGARYWSGAASEAVAATTMLEGDAGDGGQTKVAEGQDADEGRQHARVLHGVVLLERLDELGNGRPLLADGDVDTVLSTDEVEAPSASRSVHLSTEGGPRTSFLDSSWPSFHRFWLRMVSMATAVLPV
jgi:hypothetical protein